MENINAVRAEDMALIPKIFSFTTPEALPISFRLDGEQIHGLPADFSPRFRREFLDANMTRTTITGRKCGIEIRVEYTEYRDYPVTEWVAYFTNTGDEKSPILSDIRIIDAVLTGSNPRYTYGNGDTCTPDGYEFWTEKLEAPRTISPVDGTPCNGASPFAKVLFDEYGVSIGIGWPAMWESTAAPADGGVRYTLGQKRCHMALLPGETIRTPRVNFLGFTGGEDRGRNLWRRWYLAHILPREYGQPIPPKLCLHTWMIEGKPEFTGITEENQLSGIDDYLNSGLKPDIWWIDAGWYPCNFDWPFTGSWYPNPERLPNGLGPVGKKCDENGIQLLLWFEPERVRAGTDLWNNHPEWILTADDPNQGLLNLGDPACCDWLINHVDALIKESHVRIYRQDFNFAPRPIWEKNEAPDRIGALENAHVQGYLRYWDELMFRNPNLWMDSCASGGRRNEMETMRRAVTLHYTDVGYGNHPIKQKQHRMMFEWIPYFRAHNMSWDNAEGTYEGGGKPVDNFAYHCALAPAVTSMIEHDDPEALKEIGRRFHPIWRRAAEIMLSGDYYPLTECRKDPHDFYAMQFDDPVTRRGFVQVIHNTLVEEDTITVHPVFHNCDYYFENMETGECKTMAGYGLQGGFTVTLPKRSGVIWFYEY